MAKTKDKKRKSKVEYRQQGEATVTKLESALLNSAAGKVKDLGDFTHHVVEIPAGQTQSDFVLLTGTEQIPTFSVEEVFGSNNKPRKPLKHSRIRVQLNRRLTEAEVEDITHRGVQFRLSVSSDRQHVEAHGPMNSRQMFPIVAKVLAENYVNLLPRAVRTFSEYSGHSR